MGVWDVVKGLGTAAVSIMCPAAIPVIAAVNRFLPEDKQLDVATATGEQLTAARESLPPEARVEVDRIAAEVTIAQEEGWTERYIAQTKADGQSTRPKIAIGMAQVLAFEICAFTLWCFIYPEQMDNPILWTVFATLTATPAGLLGKYFGELRKEQANRLEMKPKGLFDSITGLFGGKK